MSKSVLSIGIIGLPNVGKSTLFNALLKRQVALAANYPFATIEPNVGIVDVPDMRLLKLAEISNSEKILPATVKFYDIAGLVKGASKGEGLGNKFLSHIREVDALVHVVRDFEDTNVIREGSVSAKDDIATINTELILTDIQSLEARIDRHTTVLKKEKTAQNLRKGQLYSQIMSALNAGALASTVTTASELSDADKLLLNDLHLLTSKPVLYIYNVSETDLTKKVAQNDGASDSNNIYLCAKIESELCSLSDEDQKLYMQDLGIAKSGLDIVIQQGFKLLGLHTYLTAGPKETRAWTIKKGAKAPEAAGVIHTDFERGFIRAQVVSYNDLVTTGSLKAAKEKGLLRLEGKEYVVQDGDVIEFRFNV